MSDDAHLISADATDRLLSVKLTRRAAPPLTVTVRAPTLRRSSRRGLNSEPAGMLRFGFPQGFADRLDRREYGPYLAVRFASRIDQVHFKLYALADRGGGGKHDADLRALEPTRDELVAAARWSRTHDPSAAHREILSQALAYLGVKDADLGP